MVVKDHRVDNNGLICAVKLDKNPHEEHFNRTGKIRGSKSVFGLMRINGNFISMHISTALGIFELILYA